MAGLLKSLHGNILHPITKLWRITQHTSLLYKGLDTQSGIPNNSRLSYSWGLDHHSNNCDMKANVQLLRVSVCTLTLSTKHIYIF